MLVRSIILLSIKSRSATLNTVLIPLWISNILKGPDKLLVCNSGAIVRVFLRPLNLARSRYGGALWSLARVERAKVRGEERAVLAAASDAGKVFLFDDESLDLVHTLVVR